MDYLKIRELYHHGIKGQKWDEKNGPPYPLDYEDHTAEQKRKNPKSTIDGKPSKETLKAAKKEYKNEWSKQHKELSKEMFGSHYTNLDENQWAIVNKAAKTKAEKYISEKYGDQTINAIKKSEYARTGAITAASILAVAGASTAAVIYSLKK